MHLCVQVVINILVEDNLCTRMLQSAPPVAYSNRRKRMMNREQVEQEKETGQTSYTFLLFRVQTYVPQVPAWSPLPSSKRSFPCVPGTPSGTCFPPAPLLAPLLPTTPATPCRWHPPRRSPHGHRWHYQQHPLAAAAARRPRPWPCVRTAQPSTPLGLFWMEMGYTQGRAGSDCRQAGSDCRQAGSDCRQAGSDCRQAGSDCRLRGRPD